MIRKLAAVRASSVQPRAKLHLYDDAGNMLDPIEMNANTRSPWRRGDGAASWLM